MSTTNTTKPAPTITTSTPPPRRTVCVKTWLTQGEKAILDSKCNREAMSISGWLRREITKTK